MKDDLLLVFLSFTIFITSSACQKSTADEVSILPSPTVSIPQIPLPIQSPEICSPIRKIDFKNFTYPAAGGYSGFNLRNGEKPYVHQKDDGINLNKIDYADVTNDDKEDAILFMSIQTGGSMMPNVIYIYALQNEKPKLLWSFMTGDRAEGGLKNIYADAGNLVVELFGDDRYENGGWKYDIPENKFKGLCCPTVYTKFKFKWNGKRFIEDGKPELFDYDFSEFQK